MTKKSSCCILFSILLLLTFIPITAWADPIEASVDLGLEGVLTDTPGLVVNNLFLTPNTLGAYPAWGNWSWSSDGNKIVYTSEEFNSHGEICVMNKDGSGFARLTDNGRCDSHPSFVWPDNSKIVYQKNVESSEDGEIWIMDADGSN